MALDESDCSSAGSDSDDFICSDPYTRFSIEPLQRYTVGGFHPITIHETLHGRYHILYRLGHGSFSTVWLAEDLHFLEGLTPRYVAVKIYAADTDKHSHNPAIFYALAKSTAANNNPSSWLSYIPVFGRWLDSGKKPNGQVDVGNGAIVKLLDQFSLSGPNGTHAVQVSELAGPTLHDLKQQGMLQSVPASLKRKWVYQIARGLEYLHRLGITHGDLYAQNIAISTPNLDHLSSDELQMLLGDPATYCVEWDKACDWRELGASPHKPAFLTLRLKVPLLWSLWNDFPQIQPTCRILDFSESFTGDLTTPSWLPRTPSLYAAPELLYMRCLEHVPTADIQDEFIPITSAIDVWAFGCLVYFILAQNECNPFIPGEVCSNYHPEGIMLERVVLCSRSPGGVPQSMLRWVERYNCKVVTRKQNGRYVLVKGRSQKWWQGRYEHIKEMTGGFFAEMVQALDMAFVVDPNRRGTAGDLAATINSTEW